MSGRVLIVDDDQSMCELLEADLRQRGFHVSWHTSAKEAFQVMMDEEFDVVLTDLRMSGINGIDFCDRCVANRPDVPVNPFNYRRPVLGGICVSVAGVAVNFLIAGRSGKILREQYA